MATGTGGTQWTVTGLGGIDDTAGAVAVAGFTHEGAGVGLPLELAALMLSVDAAARLRPGAAGMPAPAPPSRPPRERLRRSLRCRLLRLRRRLCHEAAGFLCEWKRMA